MQLKELLKLLFEESAVHLMGMTERSIGFDGSCAYRGGLGKMCVVGNQIHDRYYDPIMEGRCVTSSIVQRPLAESIIEKHPESKNLFLLPGDSISVFDMFRDLQVLHDVDPFSKGKDYLAGELQYIANNHLLGLTVQINGTCTQKETA